MVGMKKRTIKIDLRLKPYQQKESLIFLTAVLNFKKLTNTRLPTPDIIGDISFFILLSEKGQRVRRMSATC